MSDHLWEAENSICRGFILKIFVQSMNSLKKPGIHGAYNAVSPQHITNAELTKEIAKVLQKPLWMPNVPSFILKLIFGELSTAVLEGSRASSQKKSGKQDSGLHSMISKRLYRIYLEKNKY